MKTPIVMVAFGTTSNTITTYRHIDEKVKEHFPDHKIFWSFSSRIITERLQWEGQKEAQLPEELFCRLAEQGYARAIVQSLHLFPGSEFNSLRTVMGKAELSCIPGSPIINSPEDYTEICQVLQPFISTDSKKATLILGHGTCHPTWTAYYCLQTFLRHRFGPHIFVGVVEKYPDSEHLVDEISRAGYNEVRIIPFFLVAGMHYKRDIKGDDESSWQTRFKKRGLKTEAIDRGLGILPGFDHIIIRHIEAAIRKNTTL